MQFWAFLHQHINGAKTFMVNVTHEPLVIKVIIKAIVHRTASSMGPQSLSAPVLGEQPAEMTGSHVGSSCCTQSYCFNSCDAISAPCSCCSCDWTVQRVPALMPSCLLSDCHTERKSFATCRPHPRPPPPSLPLRPRQAQLFFFTQSIFVVLLNCTL